MNTEGDRVCKLSNSIFIRHSSREKSKCYAYAVAELSRLVRRTGATVITEDSNHPKKILHLQLSNGNPPSQSIPDGIQKIDSDSYIISVKKDSAALFSKTAKGVLNGVYDLAERMGFLFLLPGEAGEWTPENGLVPLTVGTSIHIPQFPHHGVFFSSGYSFDYSTEEWLKFYAKLRFNAIRHEIGSRELCEQLGLRFEAGGHSFPKLLPRTLFKKKSELFRMTQPIDFAGKRMADANACVTHPETTAIVAKNFAGELKKLKGTYAVHAWPDDLPAGGWCLCPTCRSFTPSDQAMLAVKMLTGVIRKKKSGQKIPYIAYHDTMVPGTQIPPPKESFLLFAPRERCYGHALDDPECIRNRFYLKCLRDYQRLFRHNVDAHTFEYYFDQILFRGLYPYLPEIIIRDMRTYHAHGIQSHLSLQVAGPEIAPEFNMLLFARAAWDKTLTAKTFNAWIARKISPENPAGWKQYLDRRARIFRKAMLLCGHDLGIYLDYRWLPQCTTRFGKKMASRYTQTSRELTACVQTLSESSLGKNISSRLRKLVQTEAARGNFEAAELFVMSCQQHAMNAYGAYSATGSLKAKSEAVRYLRKTMTALIAARKKAVELGLPENGWYLKNINRWLSKELDESFLKKLLPQ